MGLFDMLNTDSVIDLTIGLGVPKSKIIMSVPASAYKFALKNEGENTPRSPTNDEKPIILNRKQLCDLMSVDEWTLERDDDLTAPYAFNNKNWISFEDRTSIGIKGKYVSLRDLAGLGIHDIENDMKNNCSKPITQEIFQSFTNLKRKTREAVLSSLENELHTTQLSYPNHVKPSGYRITRVVDTKGHIHATREHSHTEFTCTRQGYFVHPKSCNRFYRCVKFNQQIDDYSVFEFDCPAGLAFDEITEVCVWPGSLSKGSPCPGSSEIAPVPKTRFECPDHPGYYADPENCRWFFACFDLGGPHMIPYEFRCPFGLVFDEDKLICEWPWLVPKCGGGGYTYTHFGGYGGHDDYGGHEDHGGNGDYGGHEDHGGHGDYGGHGGSWDYGGHGGSWDNGGHGNGGDGGGWDNGGHGNGGDGGSWDNGGHGGSGGNGGHGGSGGNGDNGGSGGNGGHGGSGGNGDNGGGYGREGDYGGLGSYGDDDGYGGHHVSPVSPGGGYGMIDHGHGGSGGNGVKGGHDGDGNHGGHGGYGGYDGRGGSGGHMGHDGNGGHNGNGGHKGHDGNGGHKGHDGNGGHNGNGGHKGHDGNGGHGGHNGNGGSKGGHKGGNGGHGGHNGNGGNKGGHNGGNGGHGGHNGNGGSKGGHKGGNGGHDDQEKDDDSEENYGGHDTSPVFPGKGHGGKDDDDDKHGKDDDYDKHGKDDDDKHGKDDDDKHSDEDKGHDYDHHTTTEHNYHTTTEHDYHTTTEHNYHTTTEHDYHTTTEYDHHTTEHDHHTTEHDHHTTEHDHHTTEHDHHTTEHDHHTTKDDHHTTTDYHHHTTSDYDHYTTVGYDNNEKDDHDVTVGLEFGSDEHTTKAAEHDESGESLGDYSHVGNYDYIESSKKNDSSEFRKSPSSGKINSGSGRKQVAAGSHRISLSPEGGNKGRHGSQSVYKSPQYTGHANGKVENTASDDSIRGYSTNAGYSGATRRPASVNSGFTADGSSKFSSGVSTVRPEGSSGYSANVGYTGKIKGVTPAYGSSTSAGAAYSTASGGRTISEQTGTGYTSSRGEGYTGSRIEGYTGSRGEVYSTRPSFSEVQQGFATSGKADQDSNKYSTSSGFQTDYTKTRQQTGNDRYQPNNYGSSDASGTIGSKQPTVDYSTGEYGSRIPADSVGIGSTAFTGPTPTTIYNQAGYKTISNSYPNVHITSTNGVTSSQFEGSDNGKIAGSFVSPPVSSSGSYYARGNTNQPPVSSSDPYDARGNTNQPPVSSSGSYYTRGNANQPEYVNTGTDYTNPNRYSNNVFLANQAQNSAILGVKTTPDYYPAGQPSPGGIALAEKNPVPNSPIVGVISTPAYYSTGQTSSGRIIFAENNQPEINQGNSVTAGPPITTYRGPNLFTADHRIANPLITTYRGGTNSKTIPVGSQTTPVYNRENSGYKINEYHDNGGRGTIRYNNGFVVTKIPESDFRNFSPSLETIPDIEDTSLSTSPQQFAGPGVFTPEGFTKTGPTRTGFTTAQLGGSGSYVIGTSPRPRPNLDNIGENAFAGNVGYSNRVISQSNGISTPSLNIQSGSYSTQPSLSTSSYQEATTLAPLISAEVLATNQPFVSSAGTERPYEPVKSSVGIKSSVTERPFEEIGSNSFTGRPTGAYSDVELSGGQYQPGVTDVPAGTFEPIRSDGSSGIFVPIKSSATQRPSGTFLPVKSAAVSDRPSGTFVPIKSAITDRPSGTFAPIKSSVIADRPSGTFLPVKSAAVSDRPSGTFVPIKSAITDRPSGTFVPIKNSPITDRPVGTFAPIKNSAITSRPIGTFVLVKSSAATDRPYDVKSTGAGQYQTGGQQPSGNSNYQAGEQSVDVNEQRGFGNNYNQPVYQSSATSDYRKPGYEPSAIVNDKTYQPSATSDYRNPGYQSTVSNYREQSATNNYNRPNYQSDKNYQPTSENYQGSYTNSDRTSTDYQSTVYQSTDYKQSNLQSGYQSPIVPVGYTTGTKEQFQTTIYQAAKIPGGTSVQPIVDNGYKTVVSSTKIPVIVTPAKYDSQNSISTVKPSRIETPVYQRTQVTNDYSQATTTANDRGIFGHKETSQPNMAVSLSAQAEKGQIYRGSSTTGYTVSKNDERNYVTSSNYDRESATDAEVVYIPSTTISPESGVTYRRPFTTQFPLNSPTDAEEYTTEYSFTTPSYSSEKYSTVGKTLAGSDAITTAIDGTKFDYDHQNRGSIKYTPNSAYVDEMKTKYLGTAKPIDNKQSQYTTAITPSITTYHGNYRKISPTTSKYEDDKSLSAEETNGRGRKIIVKLTDLHPILIGKLGAECTCKSDPFDIFRGPRRKHVSIPSSRGVVDLANYDESDVYVDLEADKAIERIKAEASMGQIKAEKLISQESDERLEKLEESTTPCPTDEKDPPKYNGPIIRVYDHHQGQPARLTESEAEESSSPVSSAQTSGRPISENRGSSRYIIHTDNNVASASIATGSRIANGRSGKSLFGKPSASNDRGKKKFEISKHDAASLIDNDDGECARPGLFRHPKLCNKFYVCHWDEWKQKFSRHVFNCPIHLTFDSTAGACNWPSKGPACQDDNLLV
ncbi:serine-rich adhesin for platelets-like isoform X3 [Leptopilina heterotoma]|nr:serine-rich adhesin for platelets-like isoform X3 [Leptopilina heterotoma]